MENVSLQPCYYTLARLEFSQRFMLPKLQSAQLCKSCLHSMPVIKRIKIDFKELDQSACLVLHLKDLFHIFLEPEVQGHGTSFNSCNHGSK